MNKHILNYMFSPDVFHHHHILGRQSINVALTQVYDTTAKRIEFQQRANSVAILYDNRTTIRDVSGHQKHHMSCATLRTHVNVSCSARSYIQSRNMEACVADGFYECDSRESRALEFA